MGEEMITEPRCYIRGCKHFIGVSQPDGTEKSEVLVCKAFPNGIPNPIAYGTENHIKPYKGDNGMQFEK